ncbi:kelch-like protein 2 [Metopolophium dirhodum]|uniref:kelch-like protein 2 n=1 Tax=Metopolophium dirhodum TaxID=44670 RepID=UPI00298FC50D|nr:kelch-like protein 2 [Metopolophium dirhodum]XP_060874125.1 kelch-like protein 2 [Metopolophium dirhodum]
MQNKKEKTESGRCAKYAKYEYKKSSYAETHGVLQSLRQDGLFCDIKLKTDDNEIIIAHKVLLASASPYFHAMFTNFSERNHDLVVLREIDSTALQQLVNFIYSGRIVITEENVQDLLPAANLLQLQEVKEVCCDFLNSQLCPTNCIGINAIADLHSCTKLLTSSELYIQQHFSEVVGGDEFLSLSSEKVIQLISSDKLTVPSEEKVFESVIRWVKYESSSRKYVLPQLMEHVRLPVTSKNYILKHVVQEPLIKNCYKCKDYISEALNFHTLNSEELISQNIRCKDRHGDKVILIATIFDTDERISTKLYEPKMNRWHNGPEMITNRKNAGLAVVKDNLVFAVGGATNIWRQLQSVDVLDLSSESPCWKSSVEMLVKRNYFGVGVINNKLYAVGGLTNSDGPLDSAEVLDYNTQEWRMIANMSTRRSGLGVGVLNNLLYAVGGCISSSRQLKTVERYDPSIDAWTPVAKMSVGRSWVGVGVLDGVLYAVGGEDGYKTLSIVEAYRPSTDGWTTIADMNFPRYGAGVVAVDGLLYVFGGQINKSHIEDSIECYSPITNTWTIVAPLRIHEYASARVVAINRPRHLKIHS